MNERLRSFINHLILNGVVKNNADFAEKTNIAKSQLSETLNGKRKITHNLVADICAIYPDLNREWILSGQGQMIISNNISEQKATFKDFRKLNRLTQQQAADYFGCLQSFISQIETGRSVVPESFITKIMSDGIYQLPDNMSRDVEMVADYDNSSTNISATPISPEREKYIEALEALLSYKDKEIAELKAMIAELKSK